jgi:hypothetical protein
MIEYKGKKLYVVTVEYQAYVLADEYEDAEDFAMNIVENEEPFVDCTQVTDDRPNPLGWVSHACIYHPEQNEQDTELWEVIGV